MATQAQVQPYQPNRYDQAEVIATIKQTVAKGATDAQLRVFLEVCKRTGLDPFLKEIWYVPNKGIVMAARDGYLRVANESPQFDGMETRVERDERGLPVKATCTVWRKDRNHPIICEAYFNEYVKATPVWKQYPSAMISKVAEVLALKRSFAINGVVSEEELADERGSAEASAEVAQRKIVELQKPQPAIECTDALPSEDFLEPPSEDDRPSDLEDDLRESILMVERIKAGRTNARNPNLEQMREAFGALKSRYVSIGMEKTFFGILALHGIRDLNQCVDEEGMIAARAAYKELSVDVSNREARRQRRAQ